MRTPQAWGQPCPHPDCASAQMIHRGNLRAISTSLTQSGKRRRCQCPTCGPPFAETRDTVFFDLKTPAEKGRRALKMLWGTVDLAGLSLGLGVTEDTGLAGLQRAAPKAAEIKAPLLRDLPVPPGQLDELWHCSARQHACETDTAGASGPDSAAGRPGVWISVAPALRVMSAAVVGPRTLDTAQGGVAATTARGAGLPAFCSAGFPGDLAARIAACHVVTTVASPGKRGRPRKPLCAPQPALVSGQWGKQQQPGPLLTRSTRVVLGAARLTPLGFTISTAVVERGHLPVRQAGAPLARQTARCCKDRARRRQRVVFFQTFSTVARPHMRWRWSLPDPDHQVLGLLQPQWLPQTPAMAAGLPDHVWTFRELLTAKSEPIHNQSSSG